MTQVTSVHPDIKRFGPEVQAIVGSLTPNQIAFFNALYQKRRKDPIGSFILAVIGLERLYHGQTYFGSLKALVVPIGAFTAIRLLLNIKQIALKIAWYTELGSFQHFPYLLMAISAIPAFLWWIVDLASSFSRTWTLNEEIALETVKQVKELVDPNAPMPVSVEGENWLLILLTVIAVCLVVLAIVLMLRRVLGF